MDTTPWSEGKPDAKILFVAEAPGRTEMYGNRPLIGESGKIFNTLIAKAGINRADVSIANVLREPTDSIDPYYSPRTGRLTERGRNAQSDLFLRLWEHSPNVVVPLGSLALSCLAESTNGRITKWRGSIITSDLKGFKAVPTIHPAALLPPRGKEERMPYVTRYTVVKDLIRAREQSLFPDIRRPRRTLLIEPTLGQALDFIRECHSHPKVASDIETLNHHVSCFSLAWKPDLAMSIPIVGKSISTDYWTEDEEIIIWKAYQELLANESVCKVWQNGVTFDIYFLWQSNRIKVRTIADTMVRHRIAYPDFSAKLEYITSTFTEEPYYKDDRKLWARPHKDPDAFWLYNCRDSAVTREVEDPLCEIIENDPGLKWTYTDTMDAFEVGLYVGLRGLNTDAAGIASVLKDMEAEITREEEIVSQLAGHPLNCNSPKQCKEYFYDEKKYYVYLNRKTRKPTTDDKALSRIVRKYNCAVARQIQKVRGMRKFKGTYLDVKLDKDSRLRTVYDPRGTKTGRLSSKKTPYDTGMNFQNLDPRFKPYIVPDA